MEYLRTIESLACIGGWEMTSAAGPVALSAGARTLLCLPPEGPDWRWSDLELADDERLRLDLAIRGAWHESGEDFQLELTLAAQPGRLIEIRGVRQDSGDQKRVVGLVQDVTERHELADALRQSEEKFQQLSENLPGTVYLCLNDERYTMLFLNKEVEALTGYPREMFLSDAISFVELYHPDDVQAIEREVTSALRLRRAFHLHYRIRRRGGGYRWVHEVGVGIWRGGHLTHLEGVIMDITETRALEAQLAQAMKMESIGRLAGGIAHDFNNLLSVVTGQADLALMNPELPETTQASLQQIGEAATRAARLTQQLLAVARRQVIAQKNFAVNEALVGMADLLRTLLTSDIELQLDLDEGVGMIRADRAQFEQVVMNLTANARNAMPRGGRLIIGTRRVELGESQVRHLPDVAPGRYICMTAADNGCGMSADVCAHIFDPFYTTNSSRGGTGLGLSTCYGVVKQHGGHISVVSELDNGSEFRVYWPDIGPIRGEGEPPPRLKPAHAPAESSPGLPAPALPATQAVRVEVGSDEPTWEVKPKPLFRKPAEPAILEPDPAPRRRGTRDARILLVEDQESVRLVAEGMLKACGYDVRSVEHPQAALDLLHDLSQQVDVLISDIVMPQVLGPELARRVRTLRPQIRVLFVSGDAADSRDDIDLANPRNAFLQKPFDMKQLSTKVDDLMGQA